MQALVIDDDIVSRMALIDLLSVYGVFDLVEAGDGEAAWTMLEDGLRPVICFCDVRMPRMSGIDLLQKMKGTAALAALPFVLVSSASDRETVLQAVALGAVGYILKPLHAADARVHLEKIFKVTLDRLAEDPVATAARLNIGSERLESYLAAFDQQLVAGRGELAALLAAGNRADARLRVDAIHTGCMTLGLWQAAAGLDLVRAQEGDGAPLEAALAVVADAVRRQARRMRATAAMLGAGAPA
jgi:two-component system chemotaxis response regulator CheY